MEKYNKIIGNFGEQYAVSYLQKQNYKIILVYSFLQNCTNCIERVKFRVQNGGHNVPGEDIIRRYYKSIVKFWDEYRLMVDEWSLFFNGYNYAPAIVACGNSENHVIINEELQLTFDKIYKFAKETL